MHRALPLSLLAMTLAGCTGWPTAGRHGFAEHTLAPTPDSQLACLVEALARARGRHPADAQPARLVIADQTLTRARREAGGDLSADAARSTAAARALLASDLAAEECS
ncbi:MAG: hypothetical protein SF002_10965 [Alphaproteobacteria bacterium]|nr:hypothetical protein [Alphaproteobacteria bacterium]